MTYSPSPQPLYYLNGKVSRVKFADVAAHAQVEGNIGFGGVDDHYFLAAVVAPGQPARLNYEPVPVAIPGSDTGLHFVSWSVRPANRESCGSLPDESRRKTAVLCRAEGLQRADGDRSGSLPRD